MKNRNSKNKIKKAEKSVEIAGKMPFHLVSKFKKIRNKINKEKI